MQHEENKSRQGTVVSFAVAAPSRMIVGAADDESPSHSVMCYYRMLQLRCSGLWCRTTDVSVTNNSDNNTRFNGNKRSMRGVYCNGTPLSGLLLFLPMLVPLAMFRSWGACTCTCKRVSLSAAAGPTSISRSALLSTAVSSIEA